MDLNKLTKLLLKYPLKKEKVDLYAPIFIKEWNEIGLTDDIKQIQFLSCGFTETGDLNSLDEGLSYSAERLLIVFPGVFKGDLNLAKQYERNPEKLANYVYSSIVRGNNLGNNSPGSGWKWHGRGFFQTTWYENYKKLSKITGLDCLNNPEMLTKPDIAIKSAAIYWKSGNLSNLPNLKEVRKAVSGSYFGYEKEVLPRFNKLMEIYKTL